MKKLIFITLVVVLLAAVFPVAALAQEGAPGSDPESEWAVFQPIGDFLTNIFTTVFGLAMFVFGTVQGVELLKIFMPKTANETWLKWRRHIIVAMSAIVAVFTAVGANINLFVLYESLGEAFTIDPFFAKLITGLVVSLGSNEGYSRFLDKENSLGGLG